MASRMTNIDVHGFKKIVTSFPTGVLVMTTSYLGKDYGITINSFASLSLNPPLILFCIDKTAGSYEAFLSCDYFSANFLADSQEDIARKFASKSSNKFENINIVRHGNIAFLTDTRANMLLKHHKSYDGGDHTIIIGESVSGEVHEERIPLTYYNRKFIKSIDTLSL